MKLTKQQKEELLDIFSSVDVKKLELDYPDEDIVKWFRFGSYNGLTIAQNIIQAIDEEITNKPKIHSVR